MYGIVCAAGRAVSHPKQAATVPQGMPAHVSAGNLPAGNQGECAQTLGDLERMPQFHTALECTRMVRQPSKEGT